MRNVPIFVVALLCAGSASAVLASDEEHAVERKYVTAPPSPASQTDESVQAKSAGCLTCHTQTDASTMHLNPAVKLGCTDCHGGNSTVRVASGAQRGSEDYRKAFESAHVLPR
jgi:nitrate reductase cytochrome c-type subunit